MRMMLRDMNEFNQNLNSWDVSNVTDMTNLFRGSEVFNGNIGMLGGDPTLHPKFPEICKIYQKKIPNRRKREFWTSGFKWREYQDVILETFHITVPQIISHSLFNRVQKKIEKNTKNKAN